MGIGGEGMFYSEGDCGFILAAFNAPSEIEGDVAVVAEVAGEDEFGLVYFGGIEEIAGPAEGHFEGSGDGDIDGGVVGEAILGGEGKGFKKRGGTVGGVGFTELFLDEVVAEFCEVNMGIDHEAVGKPIGHTGGNFPPVGVGVVFVFDEVVVLNIEEKFTLTKGGIAFGFDKLHGVMGVEGERR